MNIASSTGAYPRSRLVTGHRSLRPSGRLRRCHRRGHRQCGNCPGPGAGRDSQLLLNGTGDVHTVALAAQNAELSLELFQQVRNKFVSAYQEIMKMPM